MTNRKPKSVFVIYFLKYLKQRWLDLSVSLTCFLFDTSHLDGKKA